MLFLHAHGVLESKNKMRIKLFFDGWADASRWHSRSRLPTWGDMTERANELVKAILAR